jgi:hypothetical protein
LINKLPDVDIIAGGICNFPDKETRTIQLEGRLRIQVLTYKRNPVEETKNQIQNLHSSYPKNLLVATIPPASLKKYLSTNNPNLTQE